MIALARRIEDKGMRERSLNQAARELLLAQSSDFARIETCHDAGAVSNEERIITHLRNFTTLYEALGGDCLSTKLLTTLEKNTPVFPALDYRMFRDAFRPRRRDVL
jgi:1,4-alpha-glucan branching enzyme